MYEGLGSVDRPESVHLLLFPAHEDSRVNPQMLRAWEGLLEVRDMVLKALEEVRQQGLIGNALEAKVKVRAGNGKGELLKLYAPDLRYIFIVSQVALECDPQTGASVLDIEVSRADGNKCERCWNYSAEVGKDAAYPTLCERCAPVVREIAGAGGFHP
jgi:isoleucyl-tRNA synthetase